MGKINKECFFPQSSTDMMLVKKEQKDAELDRKIEALRKKNEALMKRYQVIIFVLFLSHSDVCVIS